jgi:anti-anti-sigma factor
MTAVPRSRSAGWLRAPDSGGVADHACWGYSSDAERGAVAATWLSTGLRAGQRALYVAAGTPEALRAELAAHLDVDALVAEGSLVIAPSTALYDLSVPIDPVPQLAVYDQAVSQALADGHRGLRVAADITPLILDPQRRAAHLRWEQIADRYMTDHPLAPVCMYDTRRVTGLEAIAHAHPLQGPDDPLFSVYGETPQRSTVRGEVDALTADVLAEVLAGMPSTDREIDLGSLAFADCRAAATIHQEIVLRRAAGQDVVLVGGSPAFRRLWHACGFQPAFLAA